MNSPIVLVHGLLGFGRVRLGALGMNYFREIPETLRSAGYAVVNPPSLPMTDAIAQRAQALAKYLDAQVETAKQRFHLVAHSMGGLDCRYLIARIEGFSSRVISLTSIGTPHRGTALADLVAKNLPPGLDHAGIPTGAFRDLTPTACAGFNKTTPDAEGVRYFSIGGSVNPTVLPPSSLWASYMLLKQFEPGQNDGMVNVASAQWGESFELWEGLDHVNLINWGSIVLPTLTIGQNVVQKYLDLASRLAKIETV